jgi:hypothetical protein
VEKLNFACDSGIVRRIVQALTPTSGQEEYRGKPGPGTYRDEGSLMRISLVAATAALILSTTTAHAGPISRACMDSDRNARSHALCGCLQQVANRTLDRGDQRLAAKIFRKPQMAQDIKMSNNTSHEVFWRKYRNFGETATQTCSS